MSTLAFNKEGEPFTFDPRTAQLRLRRFRKPGARGTCEAVLDEEGEQVYIDADADYAELRQAVDNVPAFYRLDQCDEDGRPIPGLPAAYVSVEATRRSGSSSDADAMAVVRELAAINAEVAKTMADRFAAVMQSTAEILRAADGAGIAHRKPIVVSAPVADDDDDDDEEEGDAPSQADEAAATTANMIANIAAIVDTVPPLVETLSALYTKIKASAAQGAAQATPPAAATTVSGSEPASAPPHEATPSSGPVHGGVAAGASGAAHASATAATATDDTAASAEVSSPTSSPATATATAAAIATAAATTSSPTATSPTPRSPTPSGSVAEAPATASGPSSTGNTRAESLSTHAVPQQTPPSTPMRPADPVRPDAMLNPAAALTAAPPTGVRNAPLAPTPQQIAHLTAIYARLTPKEQAIAKHVIARMSPAVRARWLVDLSAQSVDQAVRNLRDALASLPLAQRDRDRG